MPKQPDLEEKRRDTTRMANLAEQGNAEAQNALGARLAQGYFVKKNLSGALYWYAQAMKQGYTYSKWNAGTMLIAGEGLPGPCVELGMQLIEQAAECDEASACEFLAQCYAQGAYGKERNAQLSAVWLERARRHEGFVEYGSPFDIEAHAVVLSMPQIEWV